MKKKLQTKKGAIALCKLCKQGQVSLTRIVLFGSLHDLAVIIGVIRRIVCYPVHALARFFSRISKQHSHLTFLHSHAFWSVSLGLFLLIMSFFVEHWSKHPIWGATIETARAAGACPLWDFISGVTKVSKEFEG